MFINGIKPDYLIMVTDYDFVDYPNVEWYAECLFSKNIDVFIKSRWLYFGENMFCHIDQVEKSMDEEKEILYLDFEDKQILDKLIFDIISKITLAKGIKRI